MPTPGVLLQICSFTVLIVYVVCRFELYLWHRCAPGQNVFGGFVEQPCTAAGHGGQFAEFPLAGARVRISQLGEAGRRRGT